MAQKLKVASPSLRAFLANESQFGNESHVERARRHGFIHCAACHRLRGHVISDYPCVACEEGSDWVLKTLATALTCPEIPALAMVVSTQEPQLSLAT